MTIIETIKDYIDPAIDCVGAVVSNERGYNVTVHYVNGDIMARTFTGRDDWGKIPHSRDAYHDAMRYRAKMIRKMAAQTRTRAR